MKFLKRTELGQNVIGKGKKFIYQRKNSLAFAINQVKDFLVNADKSLPKDLSATDQLVQISRIPEKNIGIRDSKSGKQSEFILEVDLDNPELASKRTDLSKYWVQRYELFSKFDDGIKMDEESWFSVTHEKIAKHISEKTQDDIFIDACCGVGSSCIQAANYYLHVYGIDIDPIKLEAAKHNAEIYGVANYIDFIMGDLFTVLKSFRIPFADVVFLDLPWGGPEYLSKPIFNCMTDMPLSLKSSYDLCKQQTKNVIVGLPRNTSLNSIGRLMKGEPFEIEKNFINRRLKRITLYTGNLVTGSGKGDNVAKHHDLVKNGETLVQSPNKRSVVRGIVSRGGEKDDSNGEYLCDFETDAYHGPEAGSTKKSSAVGKAKRKTNNVWNLESLA